MMSGGIWPYEGSFDEDKLDFAGSQMNPLKGDPKWDYGYMMDCLIVWSRHARERSSSGQQGKMATWLSEEWKRVISKCAVKVLAFHRR